MGTRKGKRLRGPTWEIEGLSNRRSRKHSRWKEIINLLKKEIKETVPEPKDSVPAAWWWWLENSPPKIDREPVNDKRLPRGEVFKMCLVKDLEAGRSPWVTPVGSNASHLCTDTREAEGGLHTQRRRHWDWGDAATSPGAWAASRSWERQDQVSPRAPAGRPTLLAP